MTNITVSEMHELVGSADGYENSFKNDAWVVHTQCIENYGAHEGDGKYNSGNAAWKFKGGDVYLVTGMERRQDAMAFVAAVCIRNDLYYKEFPTSIDCAGAWLADLEGNCRNNMGEWAEEFIERHVGELKVVSPEFPNLSHRLSVVAS